MTSGEKEKVLALIEAANAMARRGRGATDRWRDVVVEVGSELLGEKPRGRGGESMRSVTLGNLRRVGVTKDGEATEHTKRKATAAVDIARLEGLGDDQAAEDRAVALMTHGLRRLRQMRDELRGKPA